MSAILHLPLGPFFLSARGRYLPALTELIIEAAAFQQRTQIEEDLLKIRLKRHCFAALAAASPKSLVLSPKSNFPAEGSDQGRGEMTVPVFKSITGIADPAVTPPPVSIAPGAPSRTALTAEEHNRYPKGRW